MAMATNSGSRSIRRKREQSSPTNSCSRSIRRKREKIPPFCDYLPIDTIINILINLPAKTILNCTLVCKEWLQIIRTMISDPTFPERHYEIIQSSHFGLSLACPRKIDICKSSFKLCTLEGYKKKTKSGWYYKTELSELDVMRGTTIQKNNQVVNSCRGFILLHSTSDEKIRDRLYNCLYYAIHNPLTNENVSVPRLPIGIYDQWDCGFGFSPTSKHYKVVVLVHNKNRGTYNILIHTIGNTGPWRKLPVEKESYYILNKIREMSPRPLALNGILHWQTSKFRAPRIACFDLEEENFSLMRSPFDEDSWYQLTSIGEFRGLLCLGIRVHVKFEVEMWVMKEYGVTESWTRCVAVKEFCVTGTLSPEPNFKLHQPRLVDILDNGESIFLSDQSPCCRLLFYDPIKERFKWLPIPRAYPRAYSRKKIRLRPSELYIPSFLSLKTP